MKDAAARIYERMLVLRCQAGDEAALAELIARYSPGLRLFLRKLIGQSATADDLLQEAWFDVYRKINALQRHDAFGSWIYRIARDKAYRHLRRRPEPEPIPDENVPELEDEEQEFAAEDAELVRAALDDLPAEQREVLVLRFVEDMTYEEIAEVIVRPIGTVRSRIYYAKLALRTKIERTTIKEDVSNE